MIYIFGTSHVSQESLELVEEKIEEIDPEMIALELDMMRLNALLNDKQRKSGGPLFLRILQHFQQSIGKKTGVMPGEEMLYAYNIADRKGKEVALIDQDIRITIDKLKDVSFWEKLKALAQLVVGMMFPGSFDMVNEIPEEELIDELLFEMEFKFPEMYKVLVEDRNRHMAESLKMMADDVDGDIVAFVGAAHKKAIERELAEEGYAVSGQSSMEEQ